MFAALALVWLLFVFAAPLEAAGTALSALAYALGSFICHQQPERSFHLGAAQLPVCARCVGLYAGVALGAFAPLKLSRYRTILAAAAVPTALTWGIEVLGLASPSNAARAIAALPLGAAVAVVVIAALAGRLK